jgi:hypothetical protein
VKSATTYYILIKTQKILWTAKPAQRTPQSASKAMIMVRTYCAENGKKETQFSEQF